MLKHIQNLLLCCIKIDSRTKLYMSYLGVKGGPSDLGTKILQKILKDHPYHPKSLLIFIRETPVVENIRQQEKLKNYYGPGRHRRETQFIFT